MEDTKNIPHFISGSRSEVQSENFLTKSAKFTARNATAEEVWYVFRIQYTMVVMPEVIVIAHNIRSTHNVGAFFRTCDGFGIKKLIISGYTPYPTLENDTRLPHFADKLTRQIHKTALGAETMVPFECVDEPPIAELKAAGYAIVALEQSDRSIMLNEYQVPDKVALILGNEIDGVYQEYLDQCDAIIEIPMNGQKESFNVSVATGIALYGLLFKSSIPGVK